MERQSLSTGVSPQVVKCVRACWSLQIFPLCEYCPMRAGHIKLNQTEQDADGTDEQTFRFRGLGR